MVQMREDTKETVRNTTELVKTAFHYGFIPFVIYMGKDFNVEV